jgi:glycosyltransferase involved in cell wall biosynthesis
MSHAEGASRPLRIAHVTWGLEVGGLEKLLVEFARHADRPRVQLHFVSLSGRGNLAEAIEREGWPVVALEQGEGLRPGLVLRLAQLFRRWHIDVVHTHNTRALVYGGPAARLARAGRLIHTWHGQNLVGSPREGLLFRLLSTLPDQVVAVSADAARLMEREGIPRSRVRTILNGIDLSRFSFSGMRDDGPIVSVARLSPEKDIQTLLRAAALLSEQNSGLRLEIAGEGACLPDLKQLAAELGLNEQVRFLGQVDDVPALLARSRLFVLPSLTEGISLTLLEAMARGLPVVATRVGGNSEVVADGETGLLVSPGSPVELASALAKILRAPETARRMGHAGRRRVEQLFDIRRMVREYEDLYREALRPRPAVYRATERRARPRVLTNIRMLGRNSDLVRAKCQKVNDRSYWDVLRLWIRSLDSDVVVLDQHHHALHLLCLMRLLLPFFRPRLMSADLVLARPGTSLAERCKGFLKRVLFSQVDLFLMHLKDTRPLKECFGIPARKVRYVPFKVNFFEQIEGQKFTEGDYVFTGGRSRRDYQTFCAAMSGLPYRGLIVTPPPEQNAEHGTTLEGVRPPPNVQLLHDDGSRESWIDKIAHSRLAVFPISPETISPSGVGAYLLAMALKKCVIISDCPSTRDILIDGETAVLVPMRDVEALRFAIRKAWESDSLRHRIAKGGYRYARGLGDESTLARNIAVAVADYLVKGRQERVPEP